MFFAKHCFTEGMMHDIVVKFHTFVICAGKFIHLYTYLHGFSTKHYSVYTALLHFLSLCHSILHYITSIREARLPNWHSFWMM